MTASSARALALLGLLAASAIGAAAGPGPLDRLPPELLDATPPSARVSGEPGRIAVQSRGCRNLPLDQVRRRIVDLAIQEWAYFGFTIVDETAPGFGDGPRRQPDEPFPRWVDPAESARVVHSIAGYWSATPDGAWILDRQNRIWQGSGGVIDRWRDPWSAAFISWLMCEGGLDDAREFRHAIAHHVYIDQAIEARDSSAADAAFVAHEVGELAVEPGDLLCRARRGAYRSLAQRRDNLGDGARSHCDIVIKNDPENGRILVIGGNVRASVRLKFLPAAPRREDQGAGYYASIGQGSRVVFAHLRLRSGPIGNDALETSPTIRRLSSNRDALAALEQSLSGTRLQLGGNVRTGMTISSDAVRPTG